jgi:putative PEP-CTERM system TPR-repeat lipoprotein
MALLVFALAPPVATAVDAVALRFFEDAKSRLDEGDAPGAMLQLKNALQRSPGHLPAKILLGETYLALGQAQAALEEFVQAEQLGADFVSVALPLARTRNRLGRYQETIDSLLPSAAPEPIRAALWVELGLAHLGKGDAGSAAEAFESALRIDPSDLAARVGLARIPLQDGDYAEAIRLADQVIELSPDHAEAWFIRAAGLQALGRFDEAADAYATTLRHDPDYQQAAIGEGASLLDGGRVEEAAGVLEQLRARHPRNPLILYLLSQALERIEQPAEAARALSAAAGVVNAFVPGDLNENPGDQLLFGKILFDNNELEQAYRFLDAYVSNGGTDITGRKLLARALIALGRPGDALRVLVRITANERDDAETLTLVGDANVALGDFRAAQRAYRDALTTHRAGPAVARRLALAQFASGERETGLANLQRLVDMLPQGIAPQTELLLALLYLSDQRLDEAQRVVERLLAHDPTHQAARNLRATILMNQGQVREARAIYRQLIEEDAGFRPALFNLIRLNMRQGNLAAAAHLVNALLQRDPADPLALYESGRLLILQGQTRLALAPLIHAHELRPGWIKPVEALVDAYTRERRPADAVARAQAFAAANDSAEAQRLLARAQRQAGDLGAALESLERAAELAGLDPRLLTTVGKQQMALGAFADAADTLRRAVEADHQSTEAQLALADSLINLDRLPEAEQVLRALARQRPSLVRKDVLLADIRRLQGRWDTAVDLYAAAIRKTADPRLLPPLHQSLVAAERSDEAMRVLDWWLERQPDSVVARALKADHLLDNDQVEAALPHYEQLTRQVPDNPQFWNNLAVSYNRLQDDRALKAAWRAYDLAPKNAYVLDTLGWALTQIGDLEKGLGYLREARVRNAESAAVRYHLGVALQGYGKYREALAEIRIALALDDDFHGRADAQRRLVALEAYVD